MRLASSALLFASLVGLAACGDETPELLALDSISPDIAEARDALRIAGDGFPEGADAQVRFEGRVYRAGAPPADISVSVPAQAESRQKVRVDVTKDLVSALLGGETRHATFRGDVRLAFAPKTRGAPPITGTLRDESLDLLSDPTDDDSDPSLALAVSGQLVDRHGWQLDKGPNGQLCVHGLTESETPSRLEPGDCINQFAGVNVLSQADLVPAPGADSIVALVSRSGVATPVAIAIDATGLRPQVPEAWLWTLVAVCLLTGLVVVCRGPLSTALGLLENALSQALEAPKRRAGQSSPVLWSLLPFLCVSGLFAAAGLHLAPMAADFDLLLIFGGSAGLLLVAQFLGGGRTPKGWRPGAALRASLRGIIVHLTILFALAASVLKHASLSLLGVTAEQGPWLWEFGAFNSPGSYLAALVLGTSTTLLALTRLGQPRRRKRPRARIELSRFLLDASTWMGAGLLIGVYLGGYAAPKGIEWQWLSPRAAGVLVFQLKLTVVFLVVSWLRGVVPQLADKTVGSVFARWLLPIAVAASLIDLVWVSGSFAPWLQSACNWTLVCVSLLGSVALIARLFASRRRPRTATAAVNPWM